MVTNLGTGECTGRGSGEPWRGRALDNLKLNPEETRGNRSGLYGACFDLLQLNHPFVGSIALKSVSFFRVFVHLYFVLILYVFERDSSRFLVDFSNLTSPNFT